MFDDDDDPTGDIDGSSVEACIPLSFKLKIAKEVFDGLPKEAKSEVDRRREEDRQKLYRRIPEIDDQGERDAKLETHRRYFNHS
jgi:hypothetical protein